MADETLAEAPDAAPAPPPEAPDGQLEGRWTDGLQDNSLRVHPSLTKFQDVPSLAKSYIELESKIGSKGVVLPNADATPSEIRQAMSQIGCPEVPDNLGAPEIPAGLPVEENFLRSMREASWQNGLTPTQFKNLAQTLVDYQHSAFAEAGQAQQQQMTEAREKLEQRWGASTNEKLKLAQDAAQAIYGDAVNDAMQMQGPNGTVGNNPELLEVLATLGQAMQEGGVLTGSKPTPILTPKDAQEQITQAMLDKEFMSALHDERHMGHKEAYERWSTLYTAANSNAEGPTAEQGGVFIR